MMKQYLFYLTWSVLCLLAPGTCFADDPPRTAAVRLQVPFAAGFLDDSFFFPFVFVSSPKSIGGNCRPINANEIR